MEFAPTDCLLVMGRRGCGKSFLAKGIQECWPKRIILDSLGEYTREFPDAEIVRTFEAYCNALARLKSEGAESFILIFQFDPENDEADEIFDEIIRVGFYFGDVQIVIEEVQLYSSPQRLPKWLKNALLIGRHQGLSLLFTTQRPGELNKTILSQCRHIFCGQIIEGNDQRYVSAFLGQSTERLAQIPPRRFLWFSDEGIHEISNKV